MQNKNKYKKEVLLKSQKRVKMFNNAEKQEAHND